MENTAVAIGLEKASFHSNPKERQCQRRLNYCTVALISHATKAMLKILQARLEQYLNCKLPDVKAGFRKVRGTRDQTANIIWIIEKAREFQKNIYFFINYAKAFDCVVHNKLWKILREIRIPDHLTWRNINNLRYADDTILMAESEEELKSFLKKVKEESEKVGFKLNIQKTKIMASDPITSWEIDGETVETVSDFILGGSKITVDGDCSHEIKRCLLLGRKVMTNLDSILKSRDITLPTKVCLIKANVFPVVMYGCESWTVKKAVPKN